MDMPEPVNEDFDARYQESLDWLYSFVDFSMKRHVDDTHRFFKLDRMRHLMDLMGHPEARYPVVHVAGTKGKGSTAALVAGVLQAAGYRVGLYTSPHLQEFTERIRVDGQEIDKQSLVRICDQLRQLTSQVADITTFELTTALGFQYFAEQKIDFAVVEVGLGGRLDATNVVDPLVSIITPISYDHTAVLGNTLTEIAWEKAGIIKPGRPVVFSPQVAEAEKELIRVAIERGSPYVLVDESYRYKWLSLTHHSQTFQLQKNGVLTSLTGGSLVDPPLKLTTHLLGFHQIQNAVSAVAALDLIRQAGFTLKPEDVQAGFRQVVWPGRFEVLRSWPPVVIDSAHNGASMEVLAKALDDYFPGWKFLLVLGISADKQLDDMLQAIMPHVEQVITTQSTHPRAKDAKELAGLVEPYGKPVRGIAPAEEALAEALRLAGDDTGIVVAGSVFIAAAARAIWPTIYQPPKKDDRRMLSSLDEE